MVQSQARQIIEIINVGVARTLRIQRAMLGRIGSIGRFVPIACALAGCSVSPVPEPPEPGPPPELDATRVYGEGCACEGFMQLRGGAGATRYAGSVSAVNLGSGDAPVQAPPNADGSFLLDVPGSPPTEIRVQARRDALRSVPRDFEFTNATFSQRFRLAPRPFADCMPAPLELDLGATAIGSSTSRVITLPSSCTSELRVASIALRAANDAFDVDAPAAPLTVSPGQTLSVTVTFTPASAGVVEELLIIQISGPAIDRRPITVIGRGRP
jgi:hypothetical protein